MPDTPHPEPTLQSAVDRMMPSIASELEDSRKGVVRCVVVTPEKAVLDEVAEMVVVPMFDGEFGVGLNLSIQQYALSDPEEGNRRGITATIPTIHLQFAQGFDHNQLVRLRLIYFLDQVLQPLLSACWRRTLFRRQPLASDTAWRFRCRC